MDTKYDGGFAISSCNWIERTVTVLMSVHGCEKCNDKDQRADVMEPVGEPVNRSYLHGKAVETEAYMRCKSCESQWINYINDGLGGYKSFWIRW